MAFKLRREHRKDLVYYFAYGSNMLESRLRARVRYAKLVTIGQLKGYKLTFNFLAAGSGKCNIIHTGNPEDVVWGGIFSLPALRAHLLDQYEGVSYGIYERRFVDVIVDGDDQVPNVFTYVGVDGQRWQRKSALPFNWYKHHVVLGAFRLGLPEDYQTLLQGQRSEPDYLPTRYHSEARFWH